MKRRTLFEYIGWLRTTREDTPISFTAGELIDLLSEVDRRLDSCEQYRRGQEWGLRRS